MRNLRLVWTVLLLVSCATLASAATMSGVVVRDGADPDWPGALVLRDVFQTPTIIGLLPEGTEVDILPHLSNKGYTYIVTDGIRGWVKKQYITEKSGVPERSYRTHSPRGILFSDIPDSHWARKAVERLVRVGLIEKHADNFYGDKPVTRYELAVVLDRTARRAAHEAEKIEYRLKALESGSPGTAASPGEKYRSLVTLAQTIKSLQGQSEELKGRLDALEPSGSREVATKLRLIEHRLDTIERAMGNG